MISWWVQHANDMERKIDDKIKQHIHMKHMKLCHTIMWLPQDYVMFVESISISTVSVTTDGNEHFANSWDI